MADSKNILILHGEDDLCDMRMMQIILKKIGFEGDYLNLTIGSDVEKWMMDPSNPLPFVLLLDIGLPSIDGKELLKRFRSNERTMGVPILMMSGSSSERDYHECIALGANAYIQKSDDMEVIVPVMKSFIDGWGYLKEQKFF